MENNEKQYRRIPEFNETLREVEAGGRISPPVAEALEEMLPASSEAAGRWYRRQKYTERLEAQGTVDHLNRNRSTYQEILAAALARLAEFGDGAWITGLLFLVAFAACYGAEFIFNRAILPWLLGIDPNTALGIALAGAPATAPVILDRILARLLGITDPVARAVAAAGFSGRVRSAARTVFLIAAGVLTIYSIWVLADARAIASEIMNNPNATGPTDHQRGVLDLALLLVSVVLTVNGALFYLFGAHEVRLTWAKKRARKEVERIRELLRDNSAVLAKAEAAAADAQHAWDMIDDLEKVVVATFNREGQVKLAQAVSKPSPALTPSQIVREKLNRAAAA